MRHAFHVPASSRPRISAGDAAKSGKTSRKEYWAFLWGTLVMALSGFLLWFHNFALRHFPKWITDAATAVHWYEALFATFSILLWHFYMVIFDPLVYPMDTAWLDGKVSAEHYRHSRPAYLFVLQRAGLTSSPDRGDNKPPESPEAKLEPKVGSADNADPPKEKM